MAGLRQTEARGGLYERLLQRLELALDEAHSLRGHRAEPPDELELRGLSPSEVELIKAYMDHDLNWLRGWHAAAEELAMLEHLPLRKSRLNGLAGKPLGKVELRSKTFTRRRQPLCCAMCGVPADFQPGGVRACCECGSQLFRANQAG
ncbi:MULTISPECIES: hypothetical protein [Pseudomonas]|uniref:hypothetical protein n=1 Tax=Pseudomonas TaxID=286 RepID=UPI000854C9CB|nr:MULTISPECIES: hypothetical protein [Pseudomonas]MAB98797.1 hypothetical protein [Pseudomonadaceae bacterium]MBQ53740.1 hypothetical protein [Pseudomonadaceae bacterium]OEO25014.1 hypothetical protein AX279_14980 [Pseudomonas sp. J237]|tara:strand:- start:1017 stop:1460 length:444 start_codon:yes stop_codon:yes gene_type:complete